jgi:hypothetical protein
MHLIRRAWALSLAATMLAAVPAASRAQEPVVLRERLAPGYQYHVSTRVDLSGNLGLPAEKGQAAPKSLTIAGESAIEYDERVLTMAGDGRVEKTARIYRRIDFQRKVGDRPQEATIRPEVRRLVLLRKGNMEVPFSPDGPLTWGEIDLVRTDVFTPALVGLLPEKPARVGDRWPAATGAIEELTDLERIEGKVECRLEELTTLQGRRHARIAFAGTVRGTNEDGPNRQQLDGYLFFDRESNHVSYLSLRGLSSPLDDKGNPLGTVTGRFVLTRQAHHRAPDLSAEALKNWTLEPSADNTLLLYDNPDLGLRLLYPRRWHIAGVRGTQVAIDDPQGSGLLLTLEPPARVPTGAQFLAESRDYLQQQKAKILRVEALRRLSGPPQELERFGLEIEVMGQKAVMDYYIVRQPAGGATLAARLQQTDLANLQKDVERIARSVQVRAKAGK